MPVEGRGDDGVDVRRIAVGAGAIAVMIVLSLLAAWRLIAGWGGTVHEPPQRPPPFPQPALESHPLADRQAYEAQETQKLSQRSVDQAARDRRAP